MTALDGATGTPSGFQFAAVVHRLSPPPLSNSGLSAAAATRSNHRALKTKPWLLELAVEAIVNVPPIPCAETSTVPLVPERG